MVQPLVTIPAARIGSNAIAMKGGSEKALVGAEALLVGRRMWRLLPVEYPAGTDPERAETRKPALSAGFRL